MPHHARGIFDTDQCARLLGGRQIDDALLPYAIALLVGRKAQNLRRLMVCIRFFIAIAADIHDFAARMPR